MPDTDTTDEDEELDEAAQGTNATADDAKGEDTGEIDAIGEAAGFVVRDEKPFRGIEEIDRRDQHRWELDPASEAEDAAGREDEPVHPSR